MATEQSIQLSKENGWLPVNIMVNMLQFITPTQRLVNLTRVNKSFHQLIYTPACFKDIWIVPVIATDLKKIKKPFICLAHKYGRSCILVNFAMRHPFVSKVIHHLTRWYLPSNEFLKRAKQKRTQFQDPLYWTKSKHEIMEIDINCDYNNNQTLSERNINIESLPNSNEILHLFLNGIKSTEYNIIFPKTLKSLYLHSFENNLFSTDLWKNQIINENRFILIEYLSIYNCDFDTKEIQYFSFKCPKLYILELINVSWKGIFYIPNTLKSIRWKGIRGKVSFKKYNKNKK
eukprot:35319_1